MDEEGALGPYTSDLHYLEEKFALMLIIIKGVKAQRDWAEHEAEER